MAVVLDDLEGSLILRATTSANLCARIDEQLCTLAMPSLARNVQRPRTTIFGQVNRRFGGNQQLCALAVPAKAGNEQRRRTIV